jgi:hypothetical protein
MWRARNSLVLTSEILVFIRFAVSRAVSCLRSQRNRTSRYLRGSLWATGRTLNGLLYWQDSGTVIHSLKRGPPGFQSPARTVCAFAICIGSVLLISVIFGSWLRTEMWRASPSLRKCILDEVVKVRVISPQPVEVVPHGRCMTIHKIRKAVRLTR